MTTTTVEPYVPFKSLKRGLVWAVLVDNELVTRADIARAEKKTPGCVGRNVRDCMIPAREFPQEYVPALAEQWTKEMSKA